jgi:formimidoylglutamate deiminase
LIHATHLQTEEINKIAKSGATIGLCPTTEANLGDGLFPLMQYVEQQGEWGIGSDSHVCIDPKQELLLLEYGQRLNSQNRVIYSSESKPSTATNLITDAATGGKRALQSAAGQIEIGARADLLNLCVPPQFCDYEPQQIISKWLFSSRDNWVSDVMVNGEWVISKGRHANQEKITFELGKILKKYF